MLDGLLVSELLGIGLDGNRKRSNGESSLHLGDIASSDALVASGLYGGLSFGCVRASSICTSVFIVRSKDREVGLVVGEGSRLDASIATHVSFGAINKLLFSKTLEFASLNLRGTFKSTD